MIAKARIFMLEQRRAIETSEAELVLRKVRGHPVEDHADAAAVKLVDHETKIVGTAITRGWREIAADLVAPRSSKRMFHDRQKLDMSATNLLHVVAELHRHLPIAEAAISLLGHAPPRARMDFINCDRGSEQVAFAARRHPAFVVKAVLRLVNDRGGGGRCLHPHRERIALEQEVFRARSDFKLVERAGFESGYEQLPYSRAAQHAHHVQPPVPSIETTDHADAEGIGRPHRERHTGDSVHLDEEGAELVTCAMMLLLA